MLLDDVAGSFEHVKKKADWTALERSTSTLGRQRDELSIASSDTEREINDLKWTFAEREFHRLRSHNINVPPRSCNELLRLSLICEIPASSGVLIKFGYDFDFLGLTVSPLCFSIRWFRAPVPGLTFPSDV